MGTLNPASLRAIREARGLNGSAMAERTGIHHSYYSRLESGQRNGPPELILALAKQLGVDVAAITNTCSCQRGAA